MFVKYPHLERFGTDEVEDINLGECYIFPKLDGTNASVWWRGYSEMCSVDGELQAGSRNRHLTLDHDNAGFLAWARENRPLVDFVKHNPHLTLYGEWLVPHSLKTYQQDAWRRFYVFDVFARDRQEFLHYDEYKPLLDSYPGIDYLPCILKARNPTYDVLAKAAENNRYLIQENSGVGEGIVIKRYDFKNKWGRTTWAKLITNTFKDKHIKEMGGAVHNTKMIEEEIAQEFLTEHMVEKIIEKIRNDSGQFGAKDIPRLLATAYHDLVTEELWQALKKHKNPKIDFKTLNSFAIKRVKEIKKELFGGT